MSIYSQYSTSFADDARTSGRYATRGDAPRPRRLTGASVSSDEDPFRFYAQMNINEHVAPTGLSVPTILLPVDPFPILRPPMDRNRGAVYINLIAEAPLLSDMLTVDLGVSSPISISKGLYTGKSPKKVLKTPHYMTTTQRLARNGRPYSWKDV